MFPLRQLVERRLEGQGDMAVGFVDLENEYEVPRESVMATLRWTGVPEARGKGEGDGRGVRRDKR